MFFYSTISWFGHTSPSYGRRYLTIRDQSSNLRILKRRLAYTPVNPTSSNGTYTYPKLAVYVQDNGCISFSSRAIVICAWVNTCLASCDSPVLLHRNSRFVEMLYCLYLPELFCLCVKLRQIRHDSQPLFSNFIKSLAFLA